MRTVMYFKRLYRAGGATVLYVQVSYRGICVVRLFVGFGNQWLHYVSFATVMRSRQPSTEVLSVSATQGATITLFLTLIVPSQTSFRIRPGFSDISRTNTN